MIPQSIDPQDARPHPAPRITEIPNLIRAPVITLIRQGSADAAKSPPCHCVIAFADIQVDVDPDLTFEARWFVDYDPNVPSSTLIQASRDIPANRDDPTKTTRTVDTYDFDADSARIVQSGVHVVDVVIGESDGFDKSNTAARPNRTMKPGYFSTEYRFAVDVRLEQVPGQCPNTLPSSPVCQ